LCGQPEPRNNFGSAVVYTMSCNMSVPVLLEAPIYSEKLDSGRRFLDFLIYIGIYKDIRNSKKMMQGFDIYTKFSNFYI
jgi:hypothetical protein